MTDNPIFAAVDGAVPSGGDGWKVGGDGLRGPSYSRGSCCNDEFDFDYTQFRAAREPASKQLLQAQAVPRLRSQVCFVKHHQQASGFGGVGKCRG